MRQKETIIFMKNCRHPKTARTSVTRCFCGPVAQNKNPAAHGGVCEVETCGVCGATRAANINGSHVEQGAWSPAPEAGRVAD